MCGIFGYITDSDTQLTKQDRDKRKSIARGLAVANESRGDHSTGVAVISNSTDTIYKDIIPSTEFVMTSEFDRILDTGHHILTGHTRFATMGKVTKENAHPFKIGSIIGTHNGMVDNHAEIEKVEVDSQAIFHALDNANNDFTKALNTLSGVFAIAWVETISRNGLYLVKSGNPLHIAYVPKSKTYYYSSEYYHLYSIMASHYPLKQFRMLSIDENHVSHIDNNLNITVTPVAFQKYSYSTYDWKTDSFDWELDNQAEISLLTDKEKKAIVKSFTSGACYACNEIFDGIDGLYYDPMLKHSFCGGCVPDTDGYVYISPDDLMNFSRIERKRVHV